MLALTQYDSAFTERNLLRYNRHLLGSPAKMRSTLGVHRWEFILIVSHPINYCRSRGRLGTFPTIASTHALENLLRKDRRAMYNCLPQGMHQLFLLGSLLYL